MLYPSKYINLLKSASSYLVSSALHRPVMFGMPPVISIELTNCCNLACPECASGSKTMTRSRGYIDPALFREIIRQFRPHQLMLNLHFQGEPMLHPEFFTLAGYAKGIISTLHTNGHFLGEENSLKLVKSGIRNVVVSVDGMDQTTYASYRINGNLETVLGGIKQLSSANRRNGSPLDITIQMLVNRLNEHQGSEAARFASENNVSLKLKSMQVLDPSNSAKWMPSEKRFRRYDKINTIRNRIPGRCARLWFNPVVTWDGFVVPCCFDKNADHIMGDLKKESFSSIWLNPKYMEFRKTVLQNRKKIPICCNCTSGIMGVKT